LLPSIRILGNTSGHYEKRDPRKSLAQFRVLREANLALLKSLTPGAVEALRDAIPSGDRKPSSTSSACSPGHDLNHIQQIDREY